MLKMPTKAKRTVKAAIGAVLVLGIVKIVSTVIFPDPLKTHAQYTQEILSSDAIERLTGIVAKQAQSQSGLPPTQFDSSRFESDFSSCLRTDLRLWLLSDDPQLRETIRKLDVEPFVARFELGCLHKLGLT
jgi:hypothetical protein